jgi:predicted N-acyltransferase
LKKHPFKWRQHLLASRIHVKILKSVDEIGKDPIDSLSNDSFYTYEWFRTVEATPAFKLEPFYISVFDGDRLVAFAPCFLDLGGNYNFYGGPKTVPLMYKILRVGKLTGLSKGHVLLCYSPMCLRSAVLVDRGTNEQSALNLVSSGIDSVCRRERILFSSFLFVSENDKRLTSGLEGLGYAKYPYDSTLSLDVVWSSFDEYLKSFSCHMRKNVRREIRKFAESGAETELVNDFGTFRNVQ